MSYIEKAIVKETVDGELSIAYYRCLAEMVMRHAGAEVVIIDRRDTHKKRWTIIHSLGLEDVFAAVTFADSQAVKSLQAVDFVSWGLYRELEYGDPHYADIIRQKLT